MLIRIEAPADILIINKLVAQTFTTDVEAKLVMSLRENSHLTLSLVACSDEGEIIGHCLFSPITLNGEDLNWQRLAPVCVKKEYQNQGVAQALIHHGLEILTELGYPVVAVFGEVEHYRRFGFEIAQIYNIQSQWQKAEETLMLKVEKNENILGKAGTIECCPEFDLL